MVLVVPAPQDAAALEPLFVFTDIAALRASSAWQEAARQHGVAGIDEATSIGIEADAGIAENSIQAAEQARVLILGPGCLRSHVWSEGLSAAVNTCFQNGGLVASIGRTASMLGAWRSNSTTAPLEPGLGAVKESVLGVLVADADREVTLKTLVRTHLDGHEKVRGYFVSANAGAVFYRRGNETWVEAISGEVLEFTSVPKESALGRLIKRTTIKPASEKLMKRCNSHLPFDRWKSGLEIAAEWLVAARGTTVVSSGAGVSAESGIPTYRDEGGLWELYDQMEVSHIKGFVRDPLKCWRFELELHQLLQARGPNAAHRALADLEKLGVLKAIITQNVDGMHTAAGSKDVIELHGSETAGICMKAGCRRRFPYQEVFRSLGWMDEDGSTSSAAPGLPTRKRRRRTGGVYAELSDSSKSSSSSGSSKASTSISLKSKSSDESSSSKKSSGPAKFAKVVEKVKTKMSAEDGLTKMSAGPKCFACKEGVIKPDAVYFGEGLKRDVLKRALQLSAAAKALMIVGTSGSVAPACKLPKIAKQHGGAQIIEVGPHRTDLTETADILFLGSAATVLPALLEAVRDKISQKPETDGKRDV